ncbi:unnamed protein product [Paramecium primaurelia]|uniref:Uncharacterized protein n=1 Tax=Paramecium primaurelia TaxID=5886 RepID=A0A8S1P3K4_PARPR|nr:unnamed protein product [Paramecium primaurelia]
MQIQNQQQQVLREFIITSFASFEKYQSDRIQRIGLQLRSGEVPLLKNMMM